MLVLLSTFDGEAHLGAQLDSLARQEGVDWRLLVRDDGSSDGTPALLDGFAAAHPGRVRRLPGGERLGALPSFTALLRAAEGGDAYAFMDQDDVWLPGKLARAARLLSEGREAVCGRLRLVDSGLNPLGFSAVPSVPPRFASLLAHNVAAGCTMAMSPRGRDMALAAPPPPGTMHDWWCALLVTGQGGRLLFDEEPCMLYRLHGANQVGGAASLPSRALRALRGGRPDGLRLLRSHLRGLEGVVLSPEAGEAAAKLRRMAEVGPAERLRLRREAGFRHHAALGDALLTLWLLVAPP
ncbi:glycosyltransferase [Roseococcus sp. MDT2-1-1]|uniref:Glycosyltransferase n=1 Tax=Sabulicella glaciei TaxID=2984948 RepID=A0ABT3NZ86_9PROT|nr:glycosyltransferase [Roseococcus sp. MDT2-1-1]